MVIQGRRQCDLLNGCGNFYKDATATACNSCGVSDAFSEFTPHNPLDWVYDLECYPNIFTASFKHPNTGVRAFFEVSERRDDLKELLLFLGLLCQSDCRLIGYNNVGYDYPIFVCL